MLFSRATRLLLGIAFCGLALPTRAQLAAPTPTDELHCLMQPLDPARRAGQASLVVEGEVLDSKGFWDAAHQHIYTAHRVRVYQVFKGAAASEITVVTEGGTVDLDQQRLTNTLTLSAGQQGVLFLYPAPFAGLDAVAGTAWAAYGSEQGFIQYDLATATATESFRSYPTLDDTFYASLTNLTGQARRVVQANPALTTARRRVGTAARGQAPVIAALSPLTTTAGTESVLTITGTGFGATRGTGFVEFRNADDGGATFTRPLDTDYVSWSNTSIQVRVPSYSADEHPAGTGQVRVTSSNQTTATSTQVLTVVYAISNVQETIGKLTYRPGHINQNDNGGYTFRFDPNFAANAAASAAWQRALENWRCSSGINWQVGDNRTTNGVADDGQNSVGFDQSSGTTSGATLPVNVLGRTTSYYSGCRNANGSIVFYVREIDMLFSNSATWQFGPTAPSAQQIDFETVAVHELGHAQQLSHLIRPSAVMHYAVSRGQVSRTLSTVSDIAGGRLVLRTSSFPRTSCDEPAMLPAPLTRFSATGPILTWTTRDECFVQEFVVERTGADTTARNWQTLATIAAGAAGNNYGYADAQAPTSSLLYYRLRIRRPDGTLDTTTPIATTSDASALTGLALYPNPLSSGPLQFQYNTGTATTLRLYVYDALGRYIQGRAVSLQTGLNLFSLGVDGLHPGWYAVRWTDETGRKGTVRFIRL
ncbi:matrixin family metalloprotease [Hymenobacter aerilatus]|uniref:Matrixin family metalloprotease n=1 Tax=Hymenobacter aerilatus TaxID=2932251 RepID=A0A8T9SWB0_9BACT|nr:matrixin family metalloprotease [Hymenobacter aerilatus]UOR04500.1 matrixin family metalloprotease [Hymenobacter aerilatus]